MAWISAISPSGLIQAQLPIQRFITADDITGRQTQLGQQRLHLVDAGWLLQIQYDLGLKAQGLQVLQQASRLAAAGL